MCKLLAKSEREQAKEGTSKQHFRRVSFSAYCFNFLPGFLSMTNIELKCKPNKPTPRQLGLVHYVNTDTKQKQDTNQSKARVQPIKRDLQIFPHKVKGRVSEPAFGINSKSQRKHKLGNKRNSEPIFTNLCAPSLNGWLSESFSESTQTNSCPWQQVFFSFYLVGWFCFPQKVVL